MTRESLVPPSKDASNWFDMQLAILLRGCVCPHCAFPHYETTAEFYAWQPHISSVPGGVFQCRTCSGYFRTDTHEPWRHATGLITSIRRGEGAERFHVEAIGSTGPGGPPPTRYTTGEYNYFAVAMSHADVRAIVDRERAERDEAFARACHAWPSEHYDGVVLPGNLDGVYVGIPVLTSAEQLHHTQAAA